MIRVAPSVGDTLRERYELVSILGEGSFGQVFRARQIGLDSFVAVKVLQPSLVSNAEVLSRFEREVAVVKQLHHPNTIRVLDFGRTDSDIPFYVMEYLEGDPLDEVLARGPLSHGRTRRIVIQLLKSLSEAHERGIVHRDLKPANLMLCQIVGERDFVKVLDFGIAKAVAKQENENMTQTGAFLGTPAYVCPEQVLGLRDVDQRADIYATGLILGECLMGRTLVGGNSSYEIVAQHAAPTPLNLPQELLDSPFGHIILKATAKERDERYPDAVSMIDALATMSGVNEDQVFRIMSSGMHARMGSAGASRSLNSMPTTPLPGEHNPLHSARTVASHASNPSYASALDAPRDNKKKFALVGAIALLACVAAGAAIVAAGGGETSETTPDPNTGPVVAVDPEDGANDPVEPVETPPDEPDPAAIEAARAAEVAAQLALTTDAVRVASQGVFRGLPANRRVRFAGTEGAQVFSGERALGNVPFELIVPALDVTLELRADRDGFRETTTEFSFLQNEVSVELRPSRGNRNSTPRPDEGTPDGNPPQDEQTPPPTRNPIFEQAPIYDP